MTATEQAQAVIDHAQAAGDLKRFLHSLRHLAALGDRVDEWVGLDRTIDDANKRLDALRQQEAEAKAGINTLERIGNLEKAETMARSSLADVKSDEAAATMKLADLNEKINAAGSKLADLDARLTAKRNELGEIESALAVWKQKLAG